MSDLSLLKYLLTYLCPGIVGDESVLDDGAGEPSGDPGSDDAGGAAPADEFDLDDGSEPAHEAEPDDDEDDPAPGEEAAPRASRAQGRIQRQAKELRETRARLAALEAQLRAQSQPQPNHQPAVDPDVQRLQDPNLDPMERFRIEGNLAIRQTNAMAARALQEATNMSDQAKFRSLMTDTPILKKYEARVEAEVARMRAQGQQVPPREAIADYLMGKDLREGKLKPRKGSSGTQGAAPRVVNDGRGRPTGARSDVAARRGMTEAERREKRLEGKLI